ncbi:MAG: tetratricopeptide repeat protein [Elusimicrobia bacterium]|nr:tetratricopeptide repeat protein [Elusimicrobiota bacterium]
MDREESSPWSCLIAAALLAQMLWLGANTAYDPDTWWHLKTGQLVFQTHSIPTRDPYSYVLAGRPWTTFEWLFQVVIYLAYAGAGAAGVAALRVGLLAGAFLLLLRLAGGGFWAGILTSLAALAARDFFVTRPQVFDYLLLVFYLSVVDRCRGRPGRLAWLLPGLQVLWVNLHGGAALLGVGLVGLRAAVAALPGQRQDRALGPWLTLTGACLAAMLVNPHGPGIFTHAYATLFFPGQELINEWRPVASLLSWQGACLAVGAVAAVWSWESEPHLALTALVLGVMGCLQVRHVSLAMLAAAPLAARLLARLRPVPIGRRSALGAVVVMAAWSALFIHQRVGYLENVGAGLEELPDRAIRYLDDNDVSGRMFHTYNMGGYLIWKTWPRRQVFVDGRNVEYGPDFIAQALNWTRPEVWPRLDAQWRFDYAVIGNSPGYVAEVLDDSPQWALVFWDDAALVYLRRTPANAALIRRDAYRLLKPNQLTFAYLAEDLRDRRKAAAVLAELDRSVRSSDRNVDACQMRAYVLSELGRPADAVRDLQGVIRRFPRKPGPYMSLGWFHERAGRLLAARQVYEEGVRMAKWNSDRTSRAFLENNLGSIELRLGNRERARELFEDCLALEPSHPQARRNLQILDQSAKK